MRYEEQPRNFQQISGYRMTADPGCFPLPYLNALSFQNVTKKTWYHKFLLEPKGYPVACFAGRYHYFVVWLLCLEPEFSRMRSMPFGPRKTDGTGPS